MDSTVNASRTKYILKWGAIMGVVIFILSMVTRLINPNEKNAAIGYLSLALTVGTVVICMALGAKEYRDKTQGGYMTYGKAYSTSLLIGLFATLVTIIITLVALQFRMEEHKKEMLQKKLEQLDKMEEQGADEDALEMTEKMFDFFATPLGIALWLGLFSILGSLVFALLAAAIAKRNSPENTFPG